MAGVGRRGVYSGRGLEAGTDRTGLSPRLLNVRGATDGARRRQAMISGCCDRLSFRSLSVLPARYSDERKSYQMSSSVTVDASRSDSAVNARISVRWTAVSIVVLSREHKGALTISTSKSPYDDTGTCCAVGCSLGRARSRWAGSSRPVVSSGELVGVQATVQVVVVGSQIEQAMTGIVEQDHRIDVLSLALRASSMTVSGSPRAMPISMVSQPPRTIRRMAEPVVAPDPMEYPFDPPTEPYLWSRQGPRKLDPSDERTTAGRTPVLAIGSNAAPAQLDRKFGGKEWPWHDGDEAEIPVTAATVDGVDIVYAAHLAPYGSIPATLCDVEGAVARTMVTWLTPRQLERMNQTERLPEKYSLRVLDGVVREGDRALYGVYCYVANAGALVIGDGPIGLTALKVTDAALQRANQRDVWELLAVQMGVPSGIDLFTACRGETEQRNAVTAYMDEHRQPLSPKLVVTVIPVLGGTKPVHHHRHNRPYVVVVPPDLKQSLGLKRLAVVSSSNNGRRLRAIAHVVTEAPSAGGVLLDQTLRTALGIPREAPEPFGFVTLAPLELSVWKWLSERASWICGRRYVLLRVGPPDPADIEKNVCRILPEDLDAMAVGEGNRVLLLAPDGTGVQRRTLQALALPEAALERRAGLLHEQWSDRYPHVSSLLQIESDNDLRPIWLDQDTRASLGKRVRLNPGDVIMARRSVPSALLNQLLDFGVVLLASVLALDNLLPHSHVLSTSIAVLVTLLVVVARLRTRLS